MRINMKIKLALLIIVVVSTIKHANAAQHLTTQQDGEIEAFISREGLSRIKVMSDKIKVLRASENEIEVKEDEVLGEVYVLPLVDKPISLFLTTENNQTVKLLLKS